uniref:52 kDa repressor of the inhibitor of the protein kinase n=3 Tax=Cacopsylla melanoneura TaxID=428564 RepID=A0A8D8QZ09_9HEMI
MCYAVMADETADISGKEQLSIGLRFFDQNQEVIREEFVGFQVIEKQDAETIANTIDSSIISFNLMPENCIGFGFDGCSTMAGKENGVQAILRRKYKKAFFFHCSSHRLNLVVNDLNKVSEIRNTIATVKDTINFFRESPSRKQFAPNISKMCETRWSEKHKAIERFEKHFIEIVKSLDLLSTTGNNATRKSAYQLHSAIKKSSFIVSFIVIAKYSAFLTPVVNILQKKSIDMVNVCEHMDRIEELFTSDRNEAERITAEILEKAEYFAEELDIELTLPRVTERQTLRANPPASNASEYWRRTIVIPYLDSVISSMKTRFSPEHRPLFELSSIHPACMIKKREDGVLTYHGKHCQIL